MLVLIVEWADLTPLNTLAVPVRARYCAEVRTVAELQAVLRWYRPRQLPLLVLGGGSNIVLCGDFDGLVIHMLIPGIEEVREDDHSVWLAVGAGENWHRLVQFCMDFHYWGMENLALIPGSVGAAPIQNIGAYGVELCDVFAELRAVEISSGLEVVFEKDVCQFGYRDSVFKGALRDRYVITQVVFRLRQQPSPVLTYPELRESLREYAEPTPEQVFKAVCELRIRKLPDPQVMPNVGSFFKNPVLSANAFAALQQAYPAVPAFAQADGQFKVAAGWLIDQAGWKGVEQNGAAVHDRQALVLTNPSRGPGAHVLALADAIVADVKGRYGISLEMEPRVYSSSGASSE